MAFRLARPKHGWSVRRKDTHHYVVGVMVSPENIITVYWTKHQKSATAFSTYDEAQQWIIDYGGHRPCYIHERRES